MQGLTQFFQERVPQDRLQSMAGPSQVNLTNCDDDDGSLSRDQERLRKCLSLLPWELKLQILEATQDWELCETLGISHHLPITAPWLEQATLLDRAILSSRVNLCRRKIGEGHAIFTRWGTMVMVRFGYIHLLEFFNEHLPGLLSQLCEHECLFSTLASAWDRVQVLEWGKLKGVGMSNIGEQAMDEASRHGHVEILEWWKNSSLPLKYSENALSHATIMNQLEVLEWWKLSGLELKISNVLDFALTSTDTLDWWKRSGLPIKYTKAALLQLSQKGNVTLLEWWKNSGYEMRFDKEVLLGATRSCRIESLDWWLKSGLGDRIWFRWAEVEEAIEDATESESESEKVLDWWIKRGFQSSEGDMREWSALRKLV